MDGTSRPELLCLEPAPWSRIHILLIYQYLGRSKKTIIHKPAIEPILVMRRQRRFKGPFPVVPVVHFKKTV